MRNTKSRKYVYKGTQWKLANYSGLNLQTLE